LSTGIVLQPTIAGTVFSWVASGSSTNVTGYFGSSGNNITQTLFNSGFSDETVTYDVTPTANGCTGPGKIFSVKVFPFPDVYFAPASPVICANTPCVINLLSHVSSAGFSWSATSGSPGIGGYGPGNGLQINQVITNSGLTGTITYTVIPTANGCIGQPGSTAATVNPAPTVLQQPCFDLATTNKAKPFRLRGATPAGGVYSGPGVAAGFFNPVAAGAGTHQLTYTYTNIYLCSHSASFTISVAGTSFNCGNDLTDPRDGKKYKTSLIGGRCWMSQNLDFGTRLQPPDQPQTENCLAEKYCLPADPACSNYGGLYQWDELMRYNSTTGNQGICPPEWHVPTESEWQQLINAISTGVTPPADGLAAAFLKDRFLNPGFNALTDGFYYLNNSWKFLSGIPSATMFWTSGIYGPERALAKGMNNVNSSVSRYESSRGNAFPVRCTKDIP
jgi:uncharacterized protein (TIGR02145 family)